jgi:hypothetical protein
LLFVTGTAFAQQEDARNSLRAAPAPEGTGGAKLGESVYLKLGILAEAGYDSNIFYNDARRIDSPTLLVTPSVLLTNEGRKDSVQPPMRFQLGAALRYREYLGDQTSGDVKRAFNPTFNGTLGYAPSNSFSIALIDQLLRAEDPPYSPDSGVIERWYNSAILDTRITPGGGRLQNTLRYTNTVDLFSNRSAEFADRLIHDFLVGASWKWLPKTAVFIEGAVGYVQYLKDMEAAAAGKENSIAYRASVGLRGLLTPKVSVNLGVGYADSSYNNNIANPSGLSTLLVNTALIYRPGALSNITIGYDHKFQDSPFVGTFYDSDLAAISVAQQIGLFVFRGFYGYEYRRYKGPTLGLPTNRHDHTQRAGAVADFFIQRWFFAGAGYSLMVNRTTNVDVAAFPAVDYTKHVVLGRLGITY